MSAGSENRRALPRFRGASSEHHVAAQEVGKTLTPVWCSCSLSESLPCAPPCACNSNLTHRMLAVGRLLGSEGPPSGFERHCTMFEFPGTET